MKSLKSTIFLWLALLATSFSPAQDSRPVNLIGITGGDELFIAGVVLDAGEKKLLVKSTTIVESILGQDPQAATFFFFGATLEDANGIGAAGDTFRLQIPAAVAPLATVFPAVDVTTTVIAADLLDDRPERAFAIRVCSDLDADSDFTTAQWKCEVLKDFGAIFISSKHFNEWGERTTYTITCTGTTSCNKGESNIKRRGRKTELSRSPNDPRQGVLAISGSVIQIPGGIGDIFIEEFMDLTPSSNFIVDGSVTPVNFRINCSTTKDKLLNEIRMYLGCNGIKFGQFNCKNMNLVAGVQVTFRSEGINLVLLPLKSTEDFKNKFSFGPAGAGSAFRIDIQAGGDQMVASFIFAQPGIIKKCGTNGTGTDDFAEIKIQDDLTGSGGGNLDEFSGLAEGFNREP